VIDMRTFDSQTISVINTFETLTKVNVRDCLFDNKTIYFLVEEGMMGKAIGKSGQNIKIAEKFLKKNIVLFEWSPDLNKFIKNLVPEAKSFRILSETLFLQIDKKDKPLVIGKNGQKLNIIRSFLERNANINEVRIS